MISWINKHNRLGAAIAGFFSVLIFAPYFQIWAGILGFSLFIFILLNEKSKRELFKIGYVFGFVHFALGFSWVGNALLIEPESFGWLYPVVLIASGGFFGLFTAFPAMLTFFAQGKWSKLMIWCGSWVLFEWLRSFVLTGFPWNLVGYSLGFNLELIQIASLGGVYLVSLAVIIAYSVGGLWLYDRNKKVLLQVLTVISAIGIAIYVFGYWRLRNVEIKETDTIVRIVQPSIPQSMKWTKSIAENNFQQYLDLSATDNGIKPDWIIWGETASPFYLDNDEEHLMKATAILPKGSLLITGMISYQYNQGKFLPHNSMVVINSDGKIEKYYHKTHLVPFGEYVPLRKYLPDIVRPVANAIGEFGKGHGAETFKLGTFPSLGGAICYEIIFPHKIIDETNRPDVIINLTNDGWYGESAGPYEHWISAKFRAVEEGVAIIRSANNGISGMINAYGMEKGVMGLNYSGISDIKLEHTANLNTTYSRYGNRITMILCLLLMVCGVIKTRNGGTRNLR